MDLRNSYRKAKKAVSGSVRGLEKLALGAVVAFAPLNLLKDAKAEPPAIIGAYSENDELIAGGEYTIFVYLDNTALNQPIRGSQFRISNFPVNYLTSDGYGEPSPDRDFYESLDMFWQFFAPPGGLTGRLSQQGQGQIRRGDLQYYDVAVSPSAPSMILNLEFNDVALFNQTGVFYPYEVQSTPIQIISQAHNNFRNFVNCHEDGGPEIPIPPESPECVAFDLDGDNDVDMGDYAVFQGDPMMGK